jgi:drug/metabolite transporter (DMT)-like permease
MTLPALALVLVAAMLHTGWNLLLKRASDRLLVSWWAMLIGGLLFVPLLLRAWPLPDAVWPYAIASAVVEVAYFVALRAAYRVGDFSLVYPVARGAAPALLALWSVLFLRESLSGVGLIGLGLLIGGLAVVGLGQLRNRRVGGPVSWGAIALALTVATMISIYSAIDAAAVRIADAPAYTVLVFGLGGILAAPFVVARYGPQRTFGIWRNEWRTLLLIGALMLVTYVFVLMAYSQATVSYVGAIREVSIVLAALVGWRWLGEGLGRARLAGAALTFAGVLVIAAFGR